MPTSWLKTIIKRSRMTVIASLLTMCIMKIAAIHQRNFLLYKVSKKLYNSRFFFQQQNYVIFHEGFNWPFQTKSSDHCEVQKRIAGYSVIQSERFNLTTKIWTMTTVSHNEMSYINLGFVSLGETGMVTFAQSVDNHEAIVIWVFSEQIHQIFVALRSYNNDIIFCNEHSLNNKLYHSSVFYIFNQIFYFV